MPTVRFILGDGQVRVIEADAGKTLLQIALDHGVPMENACGGNGFCTTCLCRLEEGSANLQPRTDREESMGITEGHDRLGCQAIVDGDVTVRLLEG